MANDAGLADGLDERRRVFGRSPRLPAIVAERMSAAAASKVGSHIHEQRAAAVEELDHLALIHFRSDRGAFRPGAAVIVGVDGMRAAAEWRAFTAVHIAVITGHDKSAGMRAFLNLDADAWTGRVPAPCRILCGGSNLDRLRP